MRNRIVQIDHTHSRAIFMEIGERLRFPLLRNQPEPPPRIRNQLSRLRELDKESPSIVPSMEQMRSPALSSLDSSPVISTKEPLYRSLWRWL